MLRYTSAGLLDTTFNVTGKVTTAVGSGDDQGHSVVVQPDGKIVVAGYSSNGANFDMAVVRYNSDGSLDSSFNSTGRATIALGTGDDYGYGVALQVDGKILVVGYSSTAGNNDFAVARLNSDGSLDARFKLTNTLDGAPSFTEKGATVLLDSSVSIFDAELSAANNFSGATLTLARNGGANAQDVYSASGVLSALTEGGSLVVSGTTIGTVTTNIDIYQNTLICMKSGCTPIIYPDGQTAYGTNHVANNILCGSDGASLYWAGANTGLADAFGADRQAEWVGGTAIATHIVPCSDGHPLALQLQREFPK